MGLGLGIVAKIHKIVDPILNQLDKYLIYPTSYRRQIRLGEEMRKKEKISVLFVLTSLAAWKTESVYKAMSENNRFVTSILITTAGDENSLPTLREYLNLNNYSFFELNRGESIYSQIVPDIIFYQKPYNSDLSDLGLRYDHYKHSVFCFVSYALHNSLGSVDFLENNPLQNIAFQQYFENKDVSKEIASYKTNKGVNNVVTGHPACDNYLSFDRARAQDPWKEQKTPKKRIIYAPHHTIDHAHEALPYSTFLEFGDFMLEMAENYKDKVQFAFKPHPSLKPKLDRIWGKERADTYYEKWSKIENGQLETGTYLNLFMFSDAMIHDSGSFQIEYHYTHNPVMYLTHDEEGHRKGLTRFAQKAFDLHYKGHNKEEIEKFIRNVIDGLDPLKEKRIEFFNNYLLPPNGQTATQNIIDAILGEGAYA